MGRHTHLAVLILVLPAGAAASSEPPMISQLNWLIGNWNYEDRSINGDYRETGVRNCTYALNEQYIRSGYPDAETGEHPVTFRDAVVRID